MSNVPPAGPEQPQFQPPEYGYESKPKSKIPVWAWVVIVLAGCGVCGIPILAAILFPVFAQARIAAKLTHAVSVSKQISMAAIIYSSDSDDVYPPFETSQEMADKLTPYYPKQAPAADGMSDDLHQIASTYTWNTDIAEASAMNLDMKSWMFYNPEKFGEKKVLAHLDGSVKAFMPEEFDAELAIPASVDGKKP